MVVKSDQVCVDCEAYIPIDCFKGYCGDRKTVFADADASECKGYKQVKKCKFCSHYSPTEEFLGQCEYVAAPVYPDRLTWNCKDFTQARQVVNLESGGE